MEPTAVLKRWNTAALALESMHVRMAMVGFVTLHPPCNGNFFPA